MHEKYLHLKNYIRFVKRRLNKAARFLKKNHLLALRKQVSRKVWQQRQKEDELTFWNQIHEMDSLGNFASFQEKYFFINKNMFREPVFSFPNGIVADIGCGPYAGFLPYVDAKIKLAIDPLCFEYQNISELSNDILFISADGEQLPLRDESVDAIFCVNALDHMMKPDLALSEMYRVLKKGGYLALSVDIGGTPGHPVDIEEKDLEKFLQTHSFCTIQKECGTHIQSTWPKEMQIPLFVFQGIKKDS